MWTSARTFCSAESAASFKFYRWLIATCYSVIAHFTNSSQFTQSITAAAVSPELPFSTVQGGPRQKPIRVT